jgi:hypothetical protein
LRGTVPIRLKAKLFQLATNTLESIATERCKAPGGTPQPQ